MTRKISIGISEEFIPKSDMKVRVIVSINSIEDEDGADLSEDKRRLFLYHKPIALITEVQVEQCTYVGLFPIHIFNDLEKPTFGTAYPAEHADLPVTTVTLGADTRVDSASVPSDISLGYFVSDRYVSSSCAIFEGYGVAASEFKRNIIAAIREFTEVYEAYANETTLMDIVTYPVGWEEVVI